MRQAREIKLLSTCHNREEGDRGTALANLTSLIPIFEAKVQVEVSGV